MSWNLIEEVGGEERLRVILRAFYDRVFDDVIIGFLFATQDKERHIQLQFEYVSAHLGDRAGKYTGKSMLAAHKHLPILPGQFDRRHTLLAETLDRFDVPAHVRDAWLALDTSLREFVINMGAANRDEIG